MTTHVNVAHRSMPRTPKPSGLAVASAILAHAGLLLVWCASSGAGQVGVDGRSAHLIVRLIEPMLVDRPAANGPTGDRDAAAVDTSAAWRARAPEPDQPALAAASAHADTDASQRASPAVVAPAVSSADLADAAWASPGRIVVRVSPSELANGPSQAVLSVTLNDNGRPIDVQGRDAPLPATYQEAVWVVLQETRFSSAEADERPLASRVLVQAQFESSELAR